MLFANLIAFAKENNYWVINVAFYEYASLFESTQRDIFCRYPKLRTPFRAQQFRILLYKFFHKITNFMKNQKIFENFVRVIELEKGDVLRLDSENFMQQIESARIVLLRGWMFRDLTNFQNHANDIRTYFTPLEKHRRKIQNLLEQIKGECNILIGVHIRQGDYKNHMGGKHFYSPDVYVSLMKEIENFFSGKTINFLLCSDTTLDKNLFRGFSFTFGTGDIVEDLYSLARCDYIVGTKSTYARWASVYGNVPMYEIHSSEKIPSLHDFKVFMPSTTTLPEFRSNLKIL
jgi:hypothetical protein